MWEFFNTNLFETEIFSLFGPHILILLLQCAHFHFRMFIYFPQKKFKTKMIYTLPSYLSTRRIRWSLARSSDKWRRLSNSEINGKANSTRVYYASLQKSHARKPTKWWCSSKRSVGRSEVKACPAANTGPLSALFSPLVAVNSSEKEIYRLLDRCFISLWIGTTHGEETMKLVQVAIVW